MQVIPCSWSDHSLVVGGRDSAEKGTRASSGDQYQIKTPSQPARVCLDLLMSNWAEIYDTPDPSLKWADWLSVCTPSIDSHMPMKKLKLRHPSSPWLAENEDLGDMMRERDLAQKTKLKTFTRDTGRISSVRKQGEKCPV